MLIKLRGLKESECDWTSPATPRYNCFAWAVGDEQRWWQPSGSDDHYWPPNYPVDDYSVETAIRVFAEHGFTQCAGADYEEGFEKIAIFVKDDEWAHIAIQVSPTSWKSKLGGLEDIQHPLEPMSGHFYGVASCFLKRPKS